VKSITTYGIISWGGTFYNAIFQLQTCQNQAIRILLNKEQMSQHNIGIYTKLPVLIFKKINLKFTAIYLKKKT